MLRLLTPADQPALESFLSEYPAATMFLRSNLRASGVGEGDGPFHGIYAARFDGEHITDVAAQFWTDKIILFAPTIAAKLAAFVGIH